jgi:hypothetical protein
MIEGDEIGNRYRDMPSRIEEIKIDSWYNLNIKIIVPARL